MIPIVIKIAGIRKGSEKNDKCINFGIRKTPPSTIKTMPDDRLPAISTNPVKISIICQENMILVIPVVMFRNGKKNWCMCI